MSSSTAWLLIGPLSLVLAVLAWQLRRLGGSLRWSQRMGQGLLTAALTIFAGWLAGYLAFVVGWLYAPVLRAFRDNPVALPTAVYAQALLMSGVVIAACHRRWVQLLPVIVFALLAFGFGAWLVLNPQSWALPR